MGRARAPFQAWLNTEYKLLRKKKIKNQQNKGKGDNGRRLRTPPFLGNKQSRGITEDASVLLNTEETEERLCTANLATSTHITF